MSEMLESSFEFIKAGLSAFAIPIMLARKLREFSRDIKEAQLRKFQAVGLNESSAAHLVTLNRALQSKPLKSFADRTFQLVAPETLKVVQHTMKLSDVSSQQLTQEKVSTALSDLKIAVQKSQKFLAVQEQKKMSKDLGLILGRKGYTVRSKTVSSSKGILIKAKKKELVVAAKVLPTGVLSLDFAGFENGKCHEERKLVMESLEALGYQLNIRKQVAHNRRAGGEIVREIEREFSRADENWRRNIACSARRIRT